MEKQKKEWRWGAQKEQKKLPLPSLNCECKNQKTREKKIFFSSILLKIIFFTIFFLLSLLYYIKKNHQRRIKITFLSTEILMKFWKKCKIFFSLKSTERISTCFQRIAIYFPLGEKRRFFFCFNFKLCIPFWLANNCLTFSQNEEVIIFPFTEAGN